jgi:hypothetical protein
VKNNSCPWSTEMGIGRSCVENNCGGFLREDSKYSCFPLPFLPMCYQFDSNLILLRNDFAHNVIIPFSLYGNTSIMIILFGIEFFLILIFMLIPEIIQILILVKSCKIKENWRVFGSLRNQFIVLNVLSAFIPFFWTLIDVWTPFFTSGFSVIISFNLVLINFIQVVVLWLHIVQQTKDRRAKISKLNMFGLLNS